MTKFWIKPIFLRVFPCLVVGSSAIADVTKYQPEVLGVDFNRPVTPTNHAWYCERLLQQNFVNRLLLPNGTNPTRSFSGMNQLSPLEYENLIDLILRHSLVRSSLILSDNNRRHIRHFLGHKHVDIFRVHNDKTLFQWAAEVDPEGLLAEFLLNHMERNLAPNVAAPQIAPTRMPELFYDLAHSDTPISVKSWAVYFRSAAVTIDDLYRVPAYRRDRSALDSVRPAGAQIIAMINGAIEAKQNARLIEDLQAFR